MNWYGRKGQPASAGPTLPMENGFSPKPRARTSSVPVEHPQQPLVPPISPRGSSVDQHGRAAGTSRPSPPPAEPSPVPMTMTLRDLKRLLDTERRVSGGAGADAEELAPSGSSSSGHTDSSHAPTAGEAPIQRGIPLWIVVRTLKASWHADGSWPILAADEVYPPPKSPTSPTHKNKGKAREMPSRPHKDVPRSVHTSDVILRPPGTTSFQVPLPPPDLMLPGAKMPKADPGMDEIARRYRTRGVTVEEAEKRLSVLDEHSHGADEGSEEAAEHRSRTSSPNREETELTTSGRDEGEESSARIVVIPGAPHEGSDGHKADDEGEEGPLANRKAEQDRRPTEVVVVPGSFDPDSQRYGEAEDGEAEADTTISAIPRTRTAALPNDRAEPHPPVYQAEPQQALSSEATQQPVLSPAEPPLGAPPPPHADATAAMQPPLRAPPLPPVEERTSADAPSRPAPLAPAVQENTLAEPHAPARPPPLPPVGVSEVVEAHMMYEPLTGTEPASYFPGEAETTGAVQSSAPPALSPQESLPPPVAGLPMESLRQR